MTYLDVKMKTLLKRQAKVNKAAYISSMRRQEAHDAIEDAIATAILKGAYLSQDIWTIPDGWADSNQRQHFAISMSTPTKPRLKACCCADMGPMSSGEHCEECHAGPMGIRI